MTNRNFLVENGVEEAQRVKIRHWYNFVDIVNIWICQLYGYCQYLELSILRILTILKTFEILAE